VIQACVLAKVRQEWLDDVECRGRVVIAVPAHFNETQRTATTLAAEMAGLNLLALVNEPIAAALAFAEDAPLFSVANAGSREERVALVFDLGGYAFEASLLTVRPGEMTLTATNHESFLGGHDWDLRLADMLAEPFVRKHGFDPREVPDDWESLIRRAIQVKHALSVRSRAAGSLRFRGRSETMEITRSQFEGCTTDLVDRTGQMCDQLLEGAGWDWPRVSQVLLVGGATRMPMIRRMLARRLGREADNRVSPVEAVARGAAFYASAILGKRERPPALQVVSTSTHSLGIEGVNQETGERINKILIPKGTPLPAKVTREFQAKSNAQRSITFSILEGEYPLASRCVPIGRIVLRDLPADVSEPWPVEITYAYSSSGQLTVDARLRYTDRVIHLETDRPAGVSLAHVEHWKQAIAPLAGFAAYQQVRTWERRAESPGRLVVAGLPEAKPEPPAESESLLKRLMPFLFHSRSPAESDAMATGEGSAPASTSES
jgi:molecular chaperone DnaK